MPKKDVAAAVVGMLSTAGAETRAAIPEVSETSDPAAAPEPATATRVDPVVDARPTASVRHLPPASVVTTADAAPRTLRLQPATAAELRAAWLEAKRDDVLLTAQDFASALVGEALAARRRRRSTGAR